MKMHNELKEIRQKLGLSQTDFASFLGIARAAYGMAEIGLRKISGMAALRKTYLETWLGMTPETYHPEPLWITEVKEETTRLLLKKLARLRRILTDTEERTDRMKKEYSNVLDVTGRIPRLKRFQMETLDENGRMIIEKQEIFPGQIGEQVIQDFDLRKTLAAVIELAQQYKVKKSGPMAIAGMELKLAATRGEIEAIEKMLAGE